MTYPIFLIDANTIIQSSQKYYAFDIAPGYWESLLTSAKQGKIISIDKVFKEIDKYEFEDDLKKWVKNDFHFAFKSTDNEQVLSNYSLVIKKAVDNPQYSGFAKAEFAAFERADAWLIAYAKTHGCLLVTDETFEPNIKRRVKIPNICKEFNIEYINTFEMIRRLKIKLIVL